MTPSWSGSRSDVFHGTPATFFSFSGSMVHGNLASLALTMHALSIRLHEGHAAAFGANRAALEYQRSSVIVHITHERALRARSYLRAL